MGSFEGNSNYLPRFFVYIKTSKIGVYRLKALIHRVLC